MSTYAPVRPAHLAALWKGALATAVASVLFPRLNAVMYEHERLWHLDGEDRVLAPLVFVLPLLVFALVGAPVWRGRRNRPAVAALVAGAVSVVGIVAFWVSAPIIAGGLAVTLGLEGRRRGGRRRTATAGVVLGCLGLVAGCALWLVNA